MTPLQKNLVARLEMYVIFRSVEPLAGTRATLKFRGKQFEKHGYEYFKL